MSGATDKTLRSWEEVAAEAAQETDPQKLLQLATELNLLLAHGRKRNALPIAEVERSD
jgi:hypothetical protein